MTEPDDALLYASLARCPLCGRAAFAVDAIWLDDQQILASYSRICVHVPAVVLTVTADEVEHPEESGVDVELLLSGRRCVGRNRHGAACGAPAAPGSLFCCWHEPAQKPRRGR